MWFMQVEAGFRRQNVSRDRWYDCVMPELPRTVVTSSRSVIQDCGFGERNGYQLLKDHILKQCGKTPWQKGFALLHAPQLDDRRPSQLLQDLRALKPDGDFGKTIFECMFLSRLPTSMSDPILSSGTSDVDAMAEIADRLFDKPAPPPVAVVDSVSAVTDSVDAISGRSSPQNRRRSPDRRQPVVSRPQRAGTPGHGRHDGDGRRRDGSPSPFCFYHRRFGKKAHRCQGPCTWVPGN
jgi:hypothetical protein